MSVFEVETREVESSALRMAFAAVPWDSKLFGFGVAQIRSIELGIGDPAPTYRHFEQWCRDTSIRLVSCRLPHDRLPEAAWLESRGFRFIEMIYHPCLTQGAESYGIDLPTIVEATEHDLPTIDAIASEAFATGRFALDPRLDPRLNSRRYCSWVRTSFDNPRHRLLKAQIDDAIVGFFVVEDLPDGRAYWHLTAIAERYRGRGIGRRVWQAVIRWHAARGVHHIETTISGHNVAVMNLYAQLGFRFGRPDMTFHRTED